MIREIVTLIIALIGLLGYTMTKRTVVDAKLRSVR